MPDRCLRDLLSDPSAGSQPYRNLRPVSPHRLIGRLDYGDELALGLVSSDGLAAGEDSLADGATVGSGARVGVGVDDGPQAVAAIARLTIAISRMRTRFSTVAPPS